MSRFTSVARSRWIAAFGLGLTVMAGACSEPSSIVPAEVPVTAGVPLQALSSEFDQYDFLGFVTDDGLANDTPAQSDLNAFTRADNVAGKIGVKWAWDDVNSWTGSGQTGDACALFDTDGNTKADAAVCVRINNPNGDPTVLAQLPAPASPLLYSCGNNKADRCAQPAALLPSLGGTICEVEKLEGETFFAAGEDGADALAACSIPLAAISATATPNLLNVCSFPSGSPNSNPFDCVVTPGAGFLIIKKATTPQSSGATFSFTINPAPVGGASKSLTDNTANDEQTALLSAAPGNAYSVTEGTLPTGWTLTTAACARQTSPPTATGTWSGDAVTGISVTSGETTICTFTNTQATPTISVTKTPNPSSIPETGGSVTYTVEVTNTAAISMTVSSLIDDKFGDLDGKGTCNSAANPYGALAPAAKYSCSFSETLAASNAGQTHVNEVTASATSAAGPATAKATATVTYTDVLPNISVTKQADITQIVATGGASVEGFNPDQTFARSGGGGSGGSTPTFASDTCDDAGANDQPAQSDLNCFSRADNVTGRLFVRWTWDDVNAWTGSGQTGDACALLDTDGDSQANYAFCVRITNPDGNPDQIIQVDPGSPILYKCKDTQNSGEIDRCASKALVQVLDATTICTVSLADEQFPNEGDDGADVRALCNLKLTDLGNTPIGNIDLLNVCSFPSGSPNSNPFDCVVTPAAGFLVISKETTPADADAYFAFTLRNADNTGGAAATNGDNDFAVQGGATSSGIPMMPGSYAVLEQMPAGWSLDANGISCTLNGNAVGTTDGNVRKNITIVQGQTTVCTFNNSLTASALVTFTVTVTNSSLEDVSLFSLEDSENPDAGTPTYSTLNNVGTCVTGGTIAGNGGTYSCTFTRTVSGPPGTEHKNKVRAVGKDNENNSDTDTSSVVTVSIVQQ